MAWGEAAAEQHEQGQPSTCLRPDGASPELPPLLGRNDFLERIEVVGDDIAEHRMHQIDAPGMSSRASYHAERQRAAEAKADQLVLMRARQIVEEADERRRRVMEKVNPHSFQPIGRKPDGSLADDCLYCRYSQNNKKVHPDG